jgi:hypothetical protein
VTRHAALRVWDTGPALDEGTCQGTVVAGHVLEYDVAAGARTYTDPHARFPAGGSRHEMWEWAAWVSPQVTPGFPVTALIPSWNATTPPGSWLEVEARVSVDGSTMSRWYTLGRWAETEDDVHPTSVPGQDDDSARVATDVLEARKGVSWSTYQLRVALMRRPGSTAVPSVRLLAVVASNMPAEPPTPVSSPDSARGRELAVPAYSQQTHRGEYEYWDSRGESWCSPTATTMVLGTWARGPAPEDYAWVDPAYDDRFVDYAARRVFDHAYRGAGNWSFNTAYAARFGTRAFVTRLRDLAEAERFITAGVPLVATVSFKESELDGAGYSTEGHLLAIIGFDQAGNVICNDPASHEIPSNDEVRVVYDRAQFERLWLGAGGGVVYVIHPPEVPLPAPACPAQPNW